MNGDAGEVRIERIRAVRTAPEGIRLVIVKVETSTPGLYGLGCATFTQRPLAVCSAIEDYLDPLLRGADAQQIEDCWHVARLSSYWRDGPVLNNALGGVDMALWDLKGKIAGLPLYQLLGGKLRASARVYVHAHGQDASEVTDSARALLEAGFSAIRCQVGVAGAGTYGVGAAGTATQQVAFDPDRYARVVPALFAHLRDELGWDVDLLHDTHERLAPPAAVRLARELEPFGLYFLEDVVAPEDHGWLEHLRRHAAVPLAIGELATRGEDLAALAVGRLVDYLRPHLSDLGGITPARKLAALAEAFGVRMAWHGPGDASPVAHAANLHLDLALSNFGIQEWTPLTDASREVFPGAPTIDAGALVANEQPGLGIDLDERAAARHPYPEDNLNGSWRPVRLADGSVIRP